MIARNEIGADKVKQLDELAAVMQEPEVNYPNPYEIALWPDDIRGKENITLFDGWHTYKQLYCDGIDPKNVTLVVDPQYSVVHAVVHLTLFYRRWNPIER